MHSSFIFTILTAAGTLTAAAPANESKGDDTVCAPGTGFFQSCSDGFRGCCKADACTIGYCPDVTGTTNEIPMVTVTPVAIPDHKTHWEPKAVVADPTVCKPGTGFFQKCANGFEGCCKRDACTLGYCPSTTQKRDDPTVCPPGTGFFQSCGNGFRGCCKQDACLNKTGYCPSSSSVKRDDPTVCAPGTGFFQSCSNGFRGCCKADACTIGYCPDLKVRESNAKRDETVCAPGTGFFQSCSNGFRGCCKQDACTIGHCPDVKAFETVTKSIPQATAIPETEQERKTESRSTDPTVCAPGTGFFQSCSNGFRGCCKKDACTIGYCPSN